MKHFTCYTFAPWDMPFWTALMAAYPRHARWIHEADGLLRVIDYRHGLHYRTAFKKPRALKLLLDGAALLVWNGSTPEYDAALAHARARKMTPIFMENGFGIAGKVQIDRAGVNAASSFARLPIEAIRTFPALTMPLTFTQPPAPDDAGEEPALPDRFVFLPLQIEDDTQIEQHAPLRWRRMERVIQAVKTGLPKGYKLVMKEHPGAPTDPELRACFPTVTWLRFMPIAKILPAAALVVTVNSNVGVQAIAAGLPVVTLGDAIYSRPELVTCAPEAGSLRGALQAALDALPDADLRARWLVALFCGCLCNADPASILARVEALEVGA